MTEEDYLSPQQIAQRLQVTDRAVIDMIAAGKLPGAVRIGVGRGVWRVPRAAYEQFLIERGAKESEST